MLQWCSEMRFKWPFQADCMQDPPAPRAYGRLAHAAASIIIAMRMGEDVDSVKRKNQRRIRTEEGALRCCQPVDGTRLDGRYAGVVHVHASARHRSTAKGGGQQQTQTHGTSLNPPPPLLRPW